ncbi:unnamed protein product [Rhizopus stolonifer]
MLRSIIRQAASPLVRSNFTRRTLHSSPVSFSDALFVHRDTDENNANITFEFNEQNKTRISDFEEIS